MRRVCSSGGTRRLDQNIVVDFEQLDDGVVGVCYVTTQARPLSDTASFSAAFVLRVVVVVAAIVQQRHQGSRRGLGRFWHCHKPRCGL